MDAIRKTIEWQVGGRNFLLKSVGDRIELQTRDGQVLDLSKEEWRGLAAALAELGLGEAGPKKDLPDRNGQPWEAVEDDDLRQAWRAGMTVSEIASRHLRTKGAIASRLLRLQLVTTKDEAEVRKA